MPKQTFLVEKGSKSTIELNWKPGFNGLKLAWKDFAISYNGKIIGKEDNALAVLFNGKDYKLPDGSNVNVKLRQELSPTFYLIRNNKRLLPSGGDQNINSARSLLLIMGAASILFTLIAGGNVNVNGISLIIASLILTSGLFARKYPLAGLLVGSLLVIIDSLFYIFSGLPSTTFFVIRILIIYFLIRGTVVAWQETRK